MKFFVAALSTLALAMGVQSSILPVPWALGVHTEIAGGGLSYTATSGPAPIIAAPIAVGAPGVIAVQAAPAAISLTQGPAIVSAAPAAVIAAPALGGAYVAQTRGAIHSAPLPGHIQSVANVNVAPAPGTI